MSDWVRRVESADAVGEAVGAAYQAVCSLPGVATLILPADSAWNPVEPASVAPVVLLPRPMPPVEAIRSVAKAIRQHRGRFGLLAGGDAALENGIEWAGRIAAAYDGQVFAEMLPARVARGRGRMAAKPIPYPIDLAIESLRDIDLLVLVGVPEPVAFFAYPGKPTRLLREGSVVLTLTDPAPDWVQLSQGMGVEAASVRSCEEFSDVLGSALKRRGPFLIECLI